MNSGMHGLERKPGYNVDALDISRGMKELSVCGYNDERTRMVIEHALMRWARGE